MSFNILTENTVGLSDTAKEIIDNFRVQYPNSTLGDSLEIPGFFCHVLETNQPTINDNCSLYFCDTEDAEVVNRALSELRRIHGKLVGYLAPYIIAYDYVIGMEIDDDTCVMSIGRIEGVDESLIPETVENYGVLLIADYVDMKRGGVDVKQAVVEANNAMTPHGITARYMYDRISGSLLLCLHRSADTAMADARGYSEMVYAALSILPDMTFVGNPGSHKLYIHSSNLKVEFM